MTKQRIKKILNIIYWAAFVFCLISFVQSLSGNIEVKNECKALYAKEELTSEDLKTRSTFVFGSKTVTIPEGQEGKKVALRYRRLYGVEHVGKFKLDKNDAIQAVFSKGRAKVLILDEEGEERFYAEVSELYFEPGETGRYDVYFVGNKFTGRVVFSTY